LSCVGRSLHEYPEIPQFVAVERERSPEIPVNSVLAIEVIYTKGSGGIKYGKDGWTIITSDGKISALYEDTVIATEGGHLVVTR
jgi:methionyl aminopeptidase